MHGAILAGGQARRFGGGPKGLALVGGRRILDILVEALQAALGSDPVLIANDPEAGTWRPDLRVVPDRVAGGALAGLYTAVVETPAPVVCLAWDMPLVPPALIAHLVARSGPCDVVLPASGGRRGVEPMCALYQPGCRGPMETALAAGDLRAVAFHESVKTCILPEAEVHQFGDPATMFFNVNTRDDLIRADALWQQLGSSR